MVEKLTSFDFSANMNAYEAKYVSVLTLKSKKMNFFCHRLAILSYASLLHSTSRDVSVRGAPDPDSDPAGYLVNSVDPRRIQIRSDPMYLDPVWIWLDLR